MAKVFESITDELRDFITAQHLFFVATAPLSSTGRVNLSPKGLDSLRILSSNQIAYLDLTGSGNETSAHLVENERITFMFCAFAGKPLILRLYGRGRVILPAALEWHDLCALFPAIPGTRQIIVADIDRVQTSCGSGVPLYDHVAQRQVMVDWAAKKGEDGLREYVRQKNRVSVDGLPTPLGKMFEREKRESSMTPEQIQALFEQTARQTQATQQQVDANARAITELRESLNQTDQQIQATQQQVNANGRAIAANDRAIAELRQSIGQTNQAVDVLVGVSSGLMSRMDGLIERLDRGQSTAEIQAESIRELVKYLNRALIHRGQLGSLP